MEMRWMRMKGDASYLSIDSSRSSDSPRACVVRDAGWDARSGASRNLRDDVRAAPGLGVVSRVCTERAVIASRWGALMHRARGASRGLDHMVATLEILVCDAPGVRARRAILLATRAIASARIFLPCAAARRPLELSRASSPGS